LVVIIVTRVRRRDVRWRQSAWIGLIGMALSFCSSLNQMPLDLFRYPTTDSYASFLLRQLLQNLVSALAAGGLLFVLAAGAEPVYREAFPDGISLGNLFLPRGLRTRRFLLGSILGITLTGVFIAYQTGFYMVAYRFGAWSPADVPYSDLLNTKFPWAFVLFGGFLPAVSEEFLFRMFGIPFIRKLSRSVAIAVVAAGFIWGFGHATYPQQPFYIRGVEVGIGGVALGLIMLRWGILPTLVWHYSVDAIYSALLLMRSQSLYFKLSGAASAGIAVLPVILALAAYWIRGGFESETGLLNRDQTPPLELPKPAFALPRPPGGGTTVGDIGELAPAISGAPIQTPCQECSTLQLLSDPQNVDFKPYLQQVLAMVKRNWLSVIPESAKLGRRGQVLLQFSIDRRGLVPKVVIASPSGVEAFDRAAVAGLSMSNPLPPLPAEYKGDQVRLQMAFSYNIGPRR